MRTEHASSLPETRHPSGGTRLWVSPFDGPVPALRQAWSLLAAEGARGLVDGLGRFVAALWHRVYRVERFCLNELDLDEAAFVCVAPPFEGIQSFVIETGEDVERLVAEGYENIVSTVPLFSHRLESGAVATCAFVNRELASISWTAFSERARLSFDRLPYRVDYENGEVCTGGAWTVRGYRGRGFGMYRFSSQIRYMKNRGSRTCRNAIAVDNIPSQRIVDRHRGRHNSIGRYRRILWWESWKETAVE